MDTNEIVKQFVEHGVDKDDLKLVLACAGSYYQNFVKSESFGEKYGDNYKDQSFINDIFTAFDNTCTALGFDSNTFLDY